MPRAKTKQKTDEELILDLHDWALGFDILLAYEALPDGFTASDAELFAFAMKEQPGDHHYSFMRIAPVLRTLVNDGMLERKTNGTYYRKDLTHD